MGGKRSPGAVEATVGLYQRLAASALAAGMTEGEKLERQLRGLALELLALRIGLERRLFPGATAQSARAWLTGEALGWAEAAELLDAVALRRAGAFPEGTEATGTAREGLWPLNEFLSAAEFAPLLRTLGELPVSELTVRTLGDAYQLLRETPLADPEGSGERKKEMRAARRRLGLFFTPDRIVQRIVRLVEPKRRPGAPAPLVCDPAMGTGHFLIAAAWRLGRGEPARARRLIETALYGIDIDPGAMRLARLAFWLEFSTPLLPLELPPHFAEGDALVGGVWGVDAVEEEARHSWGVKGIDWFAAFPAAAERGGFDILLGNPPYDILTGFTRQPRLREYAEYLRHCGSYALLHGGQLNLYRLFLERALVAARPGGTISFLIPASFLTDKAAGPLRRALAREHALSEVEHFAESERGIADVGQSLAIIRACKNAGPAARVRMRGAVPDGQGGTARRELRLDLSLAEELDPDLLPLPLAAPEDWRLVRWLSKRAAARFGDLAEGYVGEVDQTIYAAHMRDDAGALLARGCHLAPFRLDCAPAPGRQRFLREEFFLEQKGAAAADCAARVARARVAQLGIRNLECRPRLVAACVPPGVYLGNSINAWLPREGVPAELLEALLNSALYDWRFRLTSSNNNINVYEIRTLPLPEKVARYFFERERLDRAARTRLGGETAALGKTVQRLRRAAERGGALDRLREELDESVFDLFALPAAHRRWVRRAGARG